MPTQEQLRRTRGLGFIGERLFDPDIWHLSRRSVRMAMLIGIFACWIPLPIQMPLACGLSILLRSNLPMAAALCWVSNPITLPAMAYAGYKIGALLMGQAPINMPDEMTFDVITAQIGAIGLPFLLGSFVCGLVSGLAAAMAVDLAWRYLVLRRWRQRMHAEGADIWRQAFRARRDGSPSALDVSIPEPVGPAFTENRATPDSALSPPLRENRATPDSALSSPLRENRATPDSALSPDGVPARGPAPPHGARDRSQLPG